MNTTQRSIINAFWVLYQNKPIGRITIKSICTEAQVNRSTFYFYFLDIYDLLSQAERDLIDELEDRLFSIGQSKASMACIFDELHAFYKKHALALHALMGSNGDTLFCNKLQTQITPILLEKLSIDQSDKLMQHVLHFELTAMLAFFDAWYNDEDKDATAKAIPAVRGLLLNGVTSLLPSRGQGESQPF